MFLVFYLVIAKKRSVAEVQVIRIQNVILIWNFVTRNSTSTQFQFSLHFVLYLTGNDAAGIVTTVAVKTLKENAAEIEKKDLVSELEVSYLNFKIYFKSYNCKWFIVLLCETCEKLHLDYVKSLDNISLTPTTPFGLSYNICRTDIFSLKMCLR